MLAGAISTGAAIAAVRHGPDRAYLCTLFIATQEAMAPQGSKEIIHASPTGSIL